MDNFPSLAGGKFPNVTLSGSRGLRMVIVTKDILEKGKSLKGAWNLAQLKVLLPKWEFERNYAWPAKGWKSRLIGSKVSQQQIDEFLRLKDRHLSHKTRDIPGQKTIESEINSHMSSIKQEIKEASLSFDCSKCIHGLTESCIDKSEKGCIYFADEINEIYGPAYAAKTA